MLCDVLKLPSNIETTKQINSVAIDLLYFRIQEMREWIKLHPYPVGLVECVYQHHFLLAQVGGGGLENGRSKNFILHEMLHERLHGTAVAGILPVKLKLIKKLLVNKQKKLSVIKETVTQKLYLISFLSLHLASEAAFSRN